MVSLYAGNGPSHDAGHAAADLHGTDDHEMRSAQSAAACLQDTSAATRIAIVGPIGAGKTVLAAAVADRLAVPHLCLDGLYYEPGWRLVPPEDFVAAVRNALAADQWVAEGVHGGQVAELLWRRAHCVVWLDLPRWLCVLRVLRRSVRNICRRQVLWGTNIESWSRFFSRDSVALAAFHHYQASQAELRARLESSLPVPVVRLRSRVAVSTWLAGDATTNGKSCGG
jgi:adenylate kinase family enzyme